MVGRYFGSVMWTFLYTNLNWRLEMKQKITFRIPYFHHSLCKFMGRSFKVTVGNMQWYVGYATSTPKIKWVCIIFYNFEFSFVKLNSSHMSSPQQTWLNLFKHEIKLAIHKTVADYILLWYYTYVTRGNSDCALHHGIILPTPSDWVDTV